MDELSINILTPKTLVSQDDGKLVLGLLCDIYPELMPDRYGAYEPLRARFDPNDTQPFLNIWGRQIFWARNKLKVGGNVAPAWAKHIVHGWLSISINNVERADIDLLLQFFTQACETLNADFGAIHLLTMPDIVAACGTNTVGLLNPKKQAYMLSITSHRIKKNLPNLYWATVFGPAYLRHFGKDRLISSPAPTVRELANGGVLVQLSDKPNELATDFDRVDAVRLAVKEHLNNNSFFDPLLPPDHVYSVPHFILEHPDFSPA